jgi:hypothetical protein
MVERAEPEVPLAVQADLRGVSRSGLYYRPVAPSAEEVALTHRIDEIYTEFPFYGSRRVAATPRREGRPANRKAVRRHMREMGLAGAAPGPHTSRPHPAHPTYPIPTCCGTSPQRHRTPAGVYFAAPSAPTAHDQIKEGGESGFCVLTPASVS